MIWAAVRFGCRGMGLVLSDHAEVVGAVLPAVVLVRATAVVTERQVAVVAEDSVTVGEALVDQPAVEGLAEPGVTEGFPVLDPTTVDVVDGEKGLPILTTAGA
jgi:hypothetical protein